MNSEYAEIIDQHHLPHQFYQFTVKTANYPLPKPGQYVWINETFRCYVQDATSHNCTFMVDAKQKQRLKADHGLHISHPQGNPLIEPNNVGMLLVAQDNALNACIFYLKKYRARFKGLVIVGTSGYFPFHPRPSQILVDTLPGDLIATVPLLEDWGIANRLATLKGLPGCFQGTAKELAALRVEKDELEEIEILEI